MTEFRPGRFQVLPPIVKNLIIINVIMVLAQFVLFRTFQYPLSDLLGLHYFRSHLFRPWQLITHMFMHGSPMDLEATILHLFFNMFGLWMIGSILENLWGAKRFLIFYILCGLGAAACHLGVLALQYEPAVTAFNAYQENATLDTFNRFMQHHFELGSAAASETKVRLLTLLDQWGNDPGNMHYLNASKSYLYDYVYGVSDKAHGVYRSGIMDIPMVGASGAVFGVLFAFAYLFPNTLLYFYFMFPIKAKWFVAIYAVLELYAGIRNSAGDNVAHFAHLGGMVAAFIILKVWNKRRDRFF